MPSLIAGQVLPPVGPPLVGSPTNTTVSVIAPALTANALTDQTITLLANIGGGSAGTPNGGTVSFNLGSFGTVSDVAVVNGVAQTTFTIRAGTATPNTFTVGATYTGGSGFSSSTSSGSGNGTLYFCQDGASTLLGVNLQPFAVLAGSTVTNAGTTNIFGNVGVFAGNTFTGAASANVNGTIHLGDGPGPGTAQAAQADLTNAFVTLAAEPFTTDLTGTDLGGLTLTPGVYHFANSAQLTGTLTLDSLGNPAARFDFQIGTTLTTASSSRILFINGGPDNLYWQVGSSATLGTSTVFAGNILALTDITLNTTASIACGRALARNGAVTMDSNFIDPAPTLLSADLSQLSALRAQHGFYTNGNYYQNYLGLNEKWVLDKTGQTWFVIRTDGRLQQWLGGTSLGSPSATVNPLVWNDPNLLLQASLNLSAADNNQLTALSQGNGFHFGGSYYQNYLATGLNEKWFQNDAGQWYVIDTSGQISHWLGGSSLSAPIATVNPVVWDNLNLLFEAKLSSAAQTQLTALQQQYGFHSAGDYQQSYAGLDAKWFKDRAGLWYVVRTDGRVQFWNGVFNGIDSFTTLATVDLQVWTDPSLLFGA